MDGADRTEDEPISIVVPMHDEAANVAPLLAEIAAAVRDGPSYELVVVDDGSGDDTAARVRDCAAGLAAVRLIKHRERRGQSTAVYNGVRAAVHERVLVLDGDLQNDPADIPVLLSRFECEPCSDTLGLVIGHRVVRRDSALRRLSSRLANTVRARVLGDHTPDTGCGLKLIRRSAFLELPYFDHMHRFLPALMRRAGYRVVCVPVNHRARARGASHYGTLDRLWAGLADLAGVAWLAHRARPRGYEEETLR